MARVKAEEPRKTQPVETNGMQIVDAAREGNKLRVIVEGPNVERLLSNEARNLAYAQRLDHGMASAGIEAAGGTYVTPEEYEAAKTGKRNVKTWRIDFVITPML